MKDLVKKVAVAISTGALVAQTMVLPALAEITVTISGNGSGTTNTGNVGVTNTTTVTQSNVANVTNNVSASADTGHNDANDNTGDGDVDVDTGNATSTVTVTNAVNSNEAEVDCGGCPVDLTVEVKDNGTDSKNTADVDLTNETWVDQQNTAKVDNKVTSNADTGYNDANDNTGDGTVSIDTGNATADAVVTNLANANVATVGGSGQGALDLIISGNGSNSTNTIDADLANTTTLLQSNLANISNDVYVDANTGHNDANDNTGSGDVSIDTGDADAGATVDNAVNFNVAEVLDCCDLDGTVKVADNGTESDNVVELDLASTLYADQDNVYDCKKHQYPKLLGVLEWWGDWKKKACNDVSADADTGYNDAEDNTSGSGDPSVDTGDATTEVEVTNEANSNVFTTGDALPEMPDLEFDGSLSWWLWVFGLEVDSSLS